MPTKKMALLALVVVVWGCAEKRVPFTQGLRRGLDLTEKELQGLQFYLAKDLLLERIENRSGKEISRDNRLILRNGKLIAQVAAKSGTPGVFTSTEDELRMSVAFKVREKPLTFIAYTESIQTEYGATEQGQYCTAGHHGKAQHGEESAKFYAVYGDAHYEVIEGTCLLIGKDLLDEIIKTREDLTGIKLRGSK